MIDDIDEAIRGLTYQIERLTNRTPPVGARFLISARGILVRQRDDLVAVVSMCDGS